MTHPPYRWHSRFTPWVFIILTFIGLLVFRLIPIAASFYLSYLSFTDWNLLESPAFIKLGNCKELFSSKEFLRIVRNTFQFSLLYVVGSIVCRLALAVLIEAIGVTPPY